MYCMRKGCGGVFLESRVTHGFGYISLQKHANTYPRFGCGRGVLGGDGVRLENLILRTRRRNRYQYTTHA